MAKKYLFESILNKAQTNNGDDDDLDSSEEEEEESDLDSDNAELQQAFAEGRLKPGLHGLEQLKQKPVANINDHEGLKRKLKSIQIFSDNWFERLELVSEPAKVTPDLVHQYGDLEIKLNRKGEISGEELNGDRAQHDFKRELLFFRQAQTTSIEAIRRLKTQYGIKQTARPDDYFAEMVKSDEHMKKVRERLQSKQNSITASENAKKMRELKKYGKKVQQEVLLKRQKEKKELLKKIQNYKKGKEETLDFLEDELDLKSTGKNKKPHANGGGGNSKHSRGGKLTNKQKYKEARYGYGGQKKRSKSNTKESSADMSGFSARKHGRPRVSKSKNNRPGKARRQQMKQRKRK